MKNTTIPVVAPVSESAGRGITGRFGLTDIETDLFSMLRVGRDLAERGK